MDDEIEDADLPDGFALRAITGFTRRTWLAADEALIAHFTESCCWHLACWISARTELRAWDIDASHVAVGKDGWFLDITGWHRLESVCRTWHCADSDIEPFGWGGVKDWRCSSVDLGSYIFDDSTMDVIVDRVLEIFGAVPPKHA